MIEALIAGERDPQVLADLAQARMRAKIPALRDALLGGFTDHHAFICRAMLDRIDATAATIDAVSARIDDEIQPLQNVVTRLDTIPGVNVRTAQVILAEIGVDMSRFPTPGHLASWAGMCPGNHESAGKHYGGATRKADSWLRGALGEAASRAARSKDTYLQARYRRIASRRGKKRAVVAVGHSILTAIWHLISNDTDYDDLGAIHLAYPHRPRTTGPPRHRPTPPTRLPSAAPRSASAEPALPRPALFLCGTARRALQVKEPPAGHAARTVSGLCEWRQPNVHGRRQRRLRKPVESLPAGVGSTPGRRTSASRRSRTHARSGPAPGSRDPRHMPYLHPGSRQ